jgi:CCR4-NOT transcription complex subunit 9
MASLLQEIISVYPLLNPSQLTAAASNRVCNALALLQCVASHTETRGLFLSGKQHSDDARPGMSDNI